ncbi:hypothetical protein, partial [Thiolapillus sp.]|uniref:hypothetical protein n=1 Tax=Thiolapillus sp. TaxID=2017437 RepID=UPI003AF4505F
ADTHALKQHRLSKTAPPSAPVLHWLSHLTCISSMKAKNFDFHTAKISRYKQHFLAFQNFFLDEFL